MADKKNGSRAGSPAVRKAKPPPKAADLLVHLALARADLFHDEHKTAYATVHCGSRSDTLKVRSRTFQEWLEAAYFESHKRAAGASAVRDACATIAAHAVHAGPQHAVHLRTARDGDTYYVDLANEAGEVIEVKDGDWSVLAQSPVRFRRPRGTRPLPLPVRDGSVDELRPYVNTCDELQFRLIVGFILGALRPEGPYPILVLQGEHGVGKSLVARFIRALVDPNASPIRAAPGDLRDLMVGARSAHVLAFDNLSGIGSVLSDGFCRLSTGGGYGTRELYSDEEEIVLEACRPIIVNGIDDLATRPDLADRSLIVTLSPFAAGTRKREVDLVEGFNEAAPRILGALLSAFAAGTAGQGDVVLVDAPRLADFAHFVTAAERALGWPDGAYMEADRANRRDAASVALDTDPVARLVERLSRKGEWTGTASDLLERLKRLAPGDANARGFPSNVKALSDALQRAAPGLRQFGVTFERARTNQERSITIRRTPAPPASPTSPASRTSKVQSEPQDARNGASERDVTVDGATGVAVPRRRDDVAACVTALSPAAHAEIPVLLCPRDAGDGGDALFEQEEEEENEHVFADLLNGGTHEQS